MRFEFGVAQPGAELYYDTGIDSMLQPAEQPLPDFIAAVNKQFGFGHLRLTGIYRNLEYLNASGNQSVPGFGGTVSGYISTNSRTDNPIQFQFVAGQGIATYLVSFSGLNYDALGDGNGNMQAVPTTGGWVSYEHWLSKKWHANLVLGFSNFKSEKVGAFTIDGPGYSAENTSIQYSIQYGLINLMWNPVPSVVLGAEWNIGERTNIYEGSIETEDGIQSKVEKSKVANRISFGAFFNF